MKVKKICVSSFRNIKSASVSFSPGMNVLLGNNAQGKTNLLEAIYFFARGKSFRGATDKEMCAFGGEAFSAELLYEREKTEECLFYSHVNGVRTRKRNGILLDKQSEMIGKFRAVLFSPDHLQMVKGAPSERRRFLDIGISQCYPVYLSYYTSYVKHLEQRNALLHAMKKGGCVTEDEILVFSEGLAAAAAELYLYRKKYTEKLNEYASAIMNELSGGIWSLSLSYQSDIGEKEDKREIYEAYMSLFVGSLPREAAFGSTLFGIHRDDLKITLSGRDARDFASQGQQRSVVLALKMAEGEISGEVCGEYPVYLLDDVLSELDDERRAYLLRGRKERQFIVTGCDRSIVMDSEDAHFITVKNGEFFT